MQRPASPDDDDARAVAAAAAIAKAASIKAAQDAGRSSSPPTVRSRHDDGDGSTHAAARPDPLSPQYTPSPDGKAHEMISFGRTPASSPPALSDGRSHSHDGHSRGAHGAGAGAGSRGTDGTREGVTVTTTSPPVPHTRGHRATSEPGTPQAMSHKQAFDLFNLMEDADEAAFAANHDRLVMAARRLSLSDLHNDAAGVSAKDSHARAKGRRASTLPDEEDVAAAAASGAFDSTGRVRSASDASAGSGGGGGILSPRSRRMTLTSWDLDELEVEDGYTGARPEWPMTQDGALDMLDAFKKGLPLHVLHTVRILKAATHLFNAYPNVNPLTIPEGTTLAVVGDLHGQLQDLLRVFEMQGLPSDTNWFLFNGDIVDRGPAGCEVALLILAFKLLFPNAVHVNRGNHDDPAVSTVYGFRQEVREKYRDASHVDPGRGVRVYETFMETFLALPIASVIQDKVFVVHGGLCEEKGVTIARINEIDVSVCLLCVLSRVWRVHGARCVSRCAALRSLLTTPPPPPAPTCTHPHPDCNNHTATPPHRHTAPHCDPARLNVLPRRAPAARPDVERPQRDRRH